MMYPGRASVNAATTSSRTACIPNTFSNSTTYQKLDNINQSEGDTHNRNTPNETLLNSILRPWDEFVALSALPPKTALLPGLSANQSMFLTG